MHTKNIDIHHHFLSEMVEDKYIDIEYIKIKGNPADIVAKDCSEADHTKHANKNKGRAT